MINKIGYIKSINYDGLREFAIKYNSNSDFREEHSHIFFDLNIKSDDEAFDNVQQKRFLFNISAPFFKNDKKDEVAYYTNKVDEIINTIKRNFESYTEFGMKIEIKYIDDNLVGFMYSNKDAILITREFVEIENAKDFGHLTINQINNMITSDAHTGNEVSVYGDVSYEDTKNQLEVYKEKLEAAEKQQKEEIEKIRNELQKRERELREKMEGTLADLNAQIEKFRDIVFVMELNIFALRTFLGDTFTIKHIRKGKNTSDKPLIIYQKFRYLDEEFARFRALHDYSLNSLKSVSDVLAKDDNMLNTLAPVDRCVTFFKFSKDNKNYNFDKDEDALKHDEYLYGKRLGMIIRNGENVFLSYIDEEVKLQDNLFITQHTNEKAVETEDVKNIRDYKLKNQINRKLLFLILDTLVRNSNIFSELKNESIFNSDKIVFSSSDGQITSQKYPSFYDFANQDFNHKVGDEILITERHNGFNWRGGRDGWEDHRSRGYENRARDADIEKGLSFINVIDIESNGFYKHYTDVSNAGHKLKVKERLYTKEDIEKARQEGFEVIEEFDTRYFVSCERPDYVQAYDSLGRPLSRINNVNLQVYEGEFVNIMFLNSNIVKSWIDGKNVGNITGMNYVYLVGQLKDLLKKLLEREEQELIHIRKFKRDWNNTPDNLDKLLEWKKEKNVRWFTEYQAKRFVNSLI